MRNLKKEIFKRILGYGIPIAIIVYIAIPKGIAPSQSDETKRYINLTNIANNVFFVTLNYVQTNKKIPKDIKELFNYAKITKQNGFISHFDGRDNIYIKRLYNRDALKLIKLYDLPDINKIRTFKKVKKDANIAYYFSKKGNNVTVAFYIIDGEGEFLVDSKNNLFSYIEEFEITN